MKRNKKLFSIILAILLTISFPFNSYASMTNEFGEYYDNKIIVGILQSNGTTYYLDEKELFLVKQGLCDEYVMGTSNTSIFPNVVPTSIGTGISPNNVGSWSSVAVNSRSNPYLAYSKAKKVSPDMKGPGTLEYGDSVTFEYEVNINITSSEKVAIGGTWSASSNPHFVTSFPVDANKTGYVRFTPKYRTVHATRYHYFDATIVSTDNIIISQPVKLENFLDGLYELVYY